LNEKFENSHVIKALGSHELIYLQLCLAIDGRILHKINQTA